MAVEGVRFVGGFARAGSITAIEYITAKPNPISEFCGHIAVRMNHDNME